MTCPTFSETADWKYFNNSCLFFNIPDNVTSVVKQCCPAGVTSVQNNCYSFCNFTTVPEELNLINCIHSEGGKVGLTDSLLRKTHPSCYAEVNDDVVFTWISETLTTAAATAVTTSRATTTTSAPTGVASNGGNPVTKTGGMGIPYFGGLSAQEGTASKTPTTTTTTEPAAVTITLTPTTSKGFGTKGIVTSKAALGLVVFALFGVFI